MKKTRYWPLIFVLLAAIAAMRDAVHRDLWFDEALTLLNFALMPSAGAIYSNYAIPNNQIVHSLCLHWLWPLLPGGFDPVAVFRCFPAAAALATLALIYWRFRVRFGGLVLMVVLGAWALSMPFLIYGTALRGYMLGCLFTVAALDFALDYARRGRFGAGAGYFISCLLAVGTVPTNLVALAGVVLYALPLCGRHFWKNRRFWLLAALPPAALVLFYFPIARKFMTVMQLGEGWQDGFGVLYAVYMAALLAFAMLIVPMILGASVWIGRRGYNWMFSARAAIWLLPLPCCLILPVAPFPRVFFVLFPLWVLLIAGLLRHLVAFQARLERRWSANAFLIALAVAVAGWGAVERIDTLQAAFSRRAGGAEKDDFFAPYYMRIDFAPRQLWRRLPETGAAVPAAVYMSFDADPWALMAHGRFGGVRTQYLFDGPHGRVSLLPSGSLAILRVGEAPEPVAARFGGKLKWVLNVGRNAVYRFSR